MCYCSRRKVDGSFGFDIISPSEDAAVMIDARVIRSGFAYRLDNKEKTQIRKKKKIGSYKLALNGSSKIEIISCVVQLWPFLSSFKTSLRLAPCH